MRAVGAPPYWGKSSIAALKCGAASAPRPSRNRACPRAMRGAKRPGSRATAASRVAMSGMRSGRAIASVASAPSTRLPAHRRDRRREPRLQEVVEVPVEVVEVDPQRPRERLFVRRPVTVRMQHPHDRRKPVAAPRSPRRPATPGSSCPAPRPDGAGWRTPGRVR